MSVAKIVPVALAISAALAFASPARAIPWAEVGDAGDLPATAQITAGSGALTSITGSVPVTSSTDADMYRIGISDPAAFSATTVGTIGTLVNTQLFLFDATGMGIYGRDDTDVPSTPRTLLPAGSLLGPQVAGDYFLVLSGFNRDPVSIGGLIFPSSPSTTLFGPTGPGGLAPISGYTGLEAAFASRGTYTINLTGAEFASAAVPEPIPEPGTLLLLGSGLAGLAAQRLRRIGGRRRGAG